MLTVNNLCLESNDQLLFEGLSFSLEKGDVLQIKGCNGSGKTSLLKALCGLRPKTHGKISWQGKPILFHREQYCQDLLYIGHQAGLNEMLTPEENLNYTLKSSRKAQCCSIEQALEQFSLTTHSRYLTQHLSAGQKRRVALAKLALLKAKLWILDEPFSNLDTSGVELLCTLISRQVEKGIVILTSHQQTSLQIKTQELTLI